MAVQEHPRATAVSPVSRRRGSSPWAALAMAGLGLSAAALVAVAVRGGGTGDLVAASVVFLWAIASAVRAMQFRGEPLAGIIGCAAATAGPAPSTSSPIPTAP